MIVIDANTVIDRLGRVLGLNDAEMAAELGVEKSAVSAWRSMGAVPYYRLTALALERGVSLDWLFFERPVRGWSQLEVRLERPLPPNADYALRRPSSSWWILPAFVAGTAIWLGIALSFL